jgi:electron transfer flavoprotein alpha subunit
VTASSVRPTTRPQLPATATHASLDGSKSLADLGGEGQAVLPTMTHLTWIGWNGANPRHRKGPATCLHGEGPHAVGWRFIPKQRAVNLNSSRV